VATTDSCCPSLRRQLVARGDLTRLRPALALDLSVDVLPDMQEAAAKKLDGVLGRSLTHEQRKD
jgi:hypothetical protein